MLANEDYSHELAFLTETARRAGEISMRHFGKAPEYWHKEDGQGRVSVADLEIDEFVCDAISSQFPYDAILSEEREDDTARLDVSRVWIIDPIDGTEAFLNGQEFFTVSLALAVDGVPVVGVIYAPALDRMLTGCLSQGAFDNGSRMSISGQDEASAAQYLASGARYNRPMIDPDPQLELVFRPSIAYRLALVAAGEFDASFALRPSWEWDIAAGDIIMREAGGIVTDKHGFRPRYNREHPQMDGMVAGGSKLVQKLVKRLNLETKK